MSKEKLQETDEIETALREAIDQGYASAWKKPAQDLVVRRLKVVLKTVHALNNKDWKSVKPFEALQAVEEFAIKHGFKLNEDRDERSSTGVLAGIRRDAARIDSRVGRSGVDSVGDMYCRALYILQSPRQVSQENIQSSNVARNRIESAYAPGGSTGGTFGRRYS